MPIFGMISTPRFIETNPVRDDESSKNIRRKFLSVSPKKPCPDRNLLQGKEWSRLARGNGFFSGDGMRIYLMLVKLHVLFGALSLLFFWATVLTRKGGPVHRRLGQAFLFGMCGVGVTTLPLVAGVAMQGYRVLSAFLFYLTIFVGTHCWTAWRAIRDRADRARYAGRTYRTLALLNLVSAILILILGLATGRILLIVFSFAGIFAGIMNLGFARQHVSDGKWWLREHLRGMLNNGVAAHISFLTLGLGRLIPELKSSNLMLLGWIGTLTVGIVLRVVLEVKLRPDGADSPPTKFQDGLPGIS